MADQLVQIYRFRDAWLVGAMSKTTVGVWVTAESPQRLAGAVNATELGWLTSPRVV